MSEKERAHSGESAPHSKSEISLTRIYLPFAMVVAFGGVLLVSGYTVGGVMAGLNRDKTETNARLDFIEREISAIKSLLSDRAAAPGLSANCHGK